MKFLQLPVTCQSIAAEISGTQSCQKTTGTVISASICRYDSDVVRRVYGSSELREFPFSEVWITADLGPPDSLRWILDVV